MDFCPFCMADLQKIERSYRYIEITYLHACIDCVPLCMYMYASYIYIYTCMKTKVNIFLSLYPIFFGVLLLQIAARFRSIISRDLGWCLPHLSYDENEDNSRGQNAEDGLEDLGVVSALQHNFAKAAVAWYHIEPSSIKAFSFFECWVSTCAPPCLIMNHQWLSAVW